MINDSIYIRLMRDADAAAIHDILNQAIVHSTAVYDYEPLSEQDFQRWLTEKREKSLPVIVSEGENGMITGFATYGSFRHKIANRFSVEHSLYVHEQARGKGIGKRLLSEIENLALRNGMHTIFGCIDSENEVSLSLHYSLGYEKAGYLKECAWKFDRWLDLVIVQKLLK